MEEMTEKERTDAQMATLYDLILDIKTSKQETYTKQEIIDLIDTIANAKRQK